jgi:hypothetical protein
MDEVGQRASEPIELPHHERIARLEGFQARGQPGPRVLPPRGVILIEPLGRDPGGEEGIALEIEALGAIAFGDPHVAKKHRPPFLAEKLHRPP